MTAAEDPRTVVIHSRFSARPTAEVRGARNEAHLPHEPRTSGATSIALNLGPDRAAFINPMKSAAARNLVVSNSDFNVTPLDPMFILWTAMARHVAVGRRRRAGSARRRVRGAAGAHHGPTWQFREETRRGGAHQRKACSRTSSSCLPTGGDRRRHDPRHRRRQTIKEAGRSIPDSASTCGASLTSGGAHRLGGAAPTIAFSAGA